MKKFNKDVRQSSFDQIRELSEKARADIGHLAGIYQNSYPIDQEEINRYWETIQVAKARLASYTVTVEELLRSNVKSGLEEVQTNDFDLN